MKKGSIVKLIYFDASLYVDTLKVGDIGIVKSDVDSFSFLRIQFFNGTIQYIVKSHLEWMRQQDSDV